MSTLTLPVPAQWSLPSGPEAAGCARRLARDWLAAWAPDANDAIADACLAVSELAANAAEHGAPPVTLAMSAETRDAQAVVTTIVHDDGAQLPRVFDANPLEESHRGMLLVEAAADRWGARDAVDGGKDVWFEITVPAGAQAGAAPRTPSFPERIIAALTNRATAKHGAQAPRQHATIWPRPPWHLTDQRIPYALTSRAEALLESAGPEPREDS